MGLDEIMALAGKLAGLATDLMNARAAKNQADFDTAWVAMQTHLAESNLAWQMAGDPPKIT